MSTSTDGVASRSFISGSSEWPPASSLASSPCSASSGDGLVGRVGPDVVERGGDHADAPLLAWIAGHTRSGVAGMSMSVMPKRRQRVDDGVHDGRGAEPIVPASPMPLTPSGLVGLGVTVWSSVKLGSSAADGTR